MLHHSQEQAVRPVRSKSEFLVGWAGKPVRKRLPHEWCNISGGTECTEEFDNECGNGFSGEIAGGWHGRWVCARVFFNRSLPRWRLGDARSRPSNACRVQSNGSSSAAIEASFACLQVALKCGRSPKTPHFVHVCCFNS